MEVGKDKLQTSLDKNPELAQGEVCVKNGEYILNNGLKEMVKNGAGFYLFSSGFAQP